MALPLRAQEQGACQGSLSASSSSAPALAKYTPAAERAGVVFHHWLDPIRVPPRAHLVIENTNPFPVAVRWEAELRGSAGSVATGSRCVWIRAHEFAPAGPGFDYRGATLSQLRIAAADVAPLERPAPVAVAVPLPPPAPARPRPPRRPPPPRPDTPRAQAPVAAPETVRATVPLKVVRTDTIRRQAPPRIAPVPPRLAPVRRPTPPPLARTANTTMRVAAAMMLVPAGVVLGIAVAAAATLLGGIVPLGALRRRRR